MFKLAKYYVLLNLYQNAKRNVIIILSSIVLFVMLIFIFSDLMAMAQGQEKYVFLIAKWIVLLSLLVVIGWNTKVALKKVRHPFEKEDKQKVPDERKEKLLAKEQLQSRSDLILDKYRNSK